MIACDPNWKGQAVRGGWANHESSLTEAEMIALATQISGIQGMSGLPVPPMNAHFLRVRTALASATEKILITKGIHQRDKKAHFNIQITDANDANRSLTYEVFVKPGVAKIFEGAATAGGTKIKRRLAEYIPSGLSVKDGVILTWPAVYELVDLEKPVGRPRGYSFSLGNSAAPATFAEITKGQSAFHLTSKA